MHKSLTYITLYQFCYHHYFSLFHTRHEIRHNKWWNKKKLFILCSILSDGKYDLDENKCDFILKIKLIPNDNTSQNGGQISVGTI